MVIFIGFFFITNIKVGNVTGFVYQCRSVLENIKVTTSLKTCHLNVNMIDAEKYQPARQNMKFVTRSLRSLANNFIFWLGRLIFSVSIRLQKTVGCRGLLYYQMLSYWHIGMLSSTKY
jgi:hypothetical protein